MKIVQSFLITLYRYFSLFMLITILLVVAGYILLLIFFTFNNSWAVPMSLSPSQSNVLSFQPQLLSLKSERMKVTAQRDEKQGMIQLKMQQVDELNRLIARTNQAMQNEAKQSTHHSNKIKQSLTLEKKYINQYKSALKTARNNLAISKMELKAGLITKYEYQKKALDVADLEKKMNMGITDMTIIEQQANNMIQKADTLNGGSSSIDAMEALGKLQNWIHKKNEELIAIDILKKEINLHNVTLNQINDVLNHMKNSPYYEAINQTAYMTYIPYGNLVLEKNKTNSHRNVNNQTKDKTKIYDCFLGFVICQEIGVIEKVYHDEEYVSHPIFRTKIKGRLAKVKYHNKISNSDYVFLGTKPFGF